jgi:hypothetical protein
MAKNLLNREGGDLILKIIANSDETCCLSHSSDREQFEVIFRKLASLWKSNSSGSVRRIPVEFQRDSPFHPVISHN